MADNKLSLRNIVAALAQRSKTDNIQAEAFVKAFIDTIMEGLRHDTIVKIKGLGTFKLIQVDSRESINVNTGERFMIEGHTKVSFTPDPILRDEINKPFADFQTTILNDGMDVSNIGKDEPAPQPEPAEEPITPAEEPVTPPEELAIPTEEPVSPIEEPVTPTEEPVTPAEEPATPTEEPSTPVAEEPTVAPPTEDPIATSAPEAPKHQCHHIMASVCVVLLCALSYIAGYYRWFWPTPAPQQPQQETPTAIQPQPQQQKKKATKPKVNKVTEEPQQTTPPQDTPQYPQVPDGKYRIVGIKGTHKLQRGESLRQVSIRYYRTKDYVPYIIVMNNITNPDVVPLGMELKIPELIEAQP